MELRLEQAYPYGGFVAVAAAAYFFIPVGYAPEALKELLAVTVSVSGVGVGFLATAKSIILSMRGSEIIRKLRKADYYNLLINYILEGIIACFLSMLVAAGGLFLVSTPPNPGMQWFIPLLLASASLALLTAIRVIHVLNKIVRKE